MKILALIPAYNEAEKIGKVVKETLQYCDVLVVDDGSIDTTGKIAEESGAFVVTHEKNRGKGDALITGFTYALKNGYESIITLDADGQHDPSEIPKFLKKVDTYDIVIGVRGFREMPFPRKISNTITTLLLSLRTRQKIGDSQSGYRMIKTDVLRGLNFKTGGFILESELLIRAKCRIGNVRIKTIYAGEKSHVNNFRDTIKFITFMIQSMLW
ncbi:MAG: glycosyltransferase family 2 protein [Methanomicrobia archaeon]|nr:glycosyltransferase family 2 protein [Methanomicrobia archaeon]